jgi:thymidylate synthase
MMTQVCDLEAGEFIHTFGTHTFTTIHTEQLKLQLSREPKPYQKNDFEPKHKRYIQFDFDDFTLEGYEPHPLIKGNVSV